MSRLSLCILGISGAALLGACATPGVPSAPSATRSGSMSAATAEGHYALGKYYVGEQRPALALIEFTRALELDPRHVDARNGRATALAQMGELGEAVAELRRAIEIDPRAAHVMNNLGYVQFLRGEFEASAQSLRQAFALDPKSERVRANWVALAQKLPSGASLTMSAEAQGIEIPLQARAQADTPAAVAAQALPAPVQAADGAYSAVVNVTYGSTPGRDAATSASVTIAPVAAPAVAAPAVVVPAAAAPLAARAASSESAPVVINIPAPSPLPAARAAAPRPEPALPAKVEAAPKAEAVAPKAEVVAPKTEVVAPKAEVVAPKAEVVAVRSEPAAPRSEPAAARIEPAAKKPEPVAAAPMPTAAAPAVPAEAVAVANRESPAPAPAAREPQVITAPAPRIVATETSQVGAVRVHLGIVPVPAEPAVAPVQVAAPREAASLRKARIEVSNGNGTNGAAAKFGSNLRSNGLQVVRITNASSFANRRSVVYFRDGFVREAVAIAQRLPHRPAVMLGTETNLIQATDIRIVLGRDAPVVVSLMDPPVEAAPVAQAGSSLKVASVR